MRPTLFLFIILILSNTLAAQVNLDKGLVAYYPFNNNAKDESGNNNNPSQVKASFTTDRLGKPNAACFFDGKSNFIRIPDNPSLRFRGPFSMSAWVKVNGFYTGECHGNRIIMKGYSDIDNGNYLLTFDDNHSTNGNNCYNPVPDTKRQSFYGPYTVPVTKNYIVTGKWYLLTYTYDGINSLLYVDCNLQAKGTSRNYAFSNREDLFFGKLDNPKFPYWFNGCLDEVRIYNRALTKEEITALCNTPTPPATPNTTCTGDNKVAAKFDYTISNCQTVEFTLAAAKQKNFSRIQWTFGDGTTSNKKNPVHTYQNYGTYKVRAIVTSQSGCRDTVIKTIQLQPLHTDFTFTEQGQPGQLTFRVKNNKASYAWNFGDQESSQGESAITHRYTTSGQYTVQLFARNSVGCTDTVQKKIDILLPEPQAIANAPKDTVVITPPVIPKQTVQLEKRDRDVIRNIMVEQDSITLLLYDNGMIDGDTITLVYNSDILLTHQLLKSKPLTLRLKVDAGRPANELVMYAENLGSIPPNTALMVIYDGEKRYDVNISSNKQSNGIVTFTLRR